MPWCMADLIHRLPMGVPLRWAARRSSALRGLSVTGISRCCATRGGDKENPLHIWRMVDGEMTREAVMQGEAVPQ